MLALMASSWVNVSLELIATVMGGGALKVEAAHLRRVLLPVPDRAVGAALSRLGASLASEGARPATLRAIDDAVFGLVGAVPAATKVRDLIVESLTVRGVPATGNRTSATG
jgi:hypothetical protein